mgnify:CR=1 FL=1
MQNGEKMSLVFDWILLIIGSIFSIASYKKIIFKKNVSIANYIILVVYIFCILPVLLNYLIGIPQYKTVYWYKVFINPMENNKVTIIYDTYILFTIILLYIYSKKVNPNFKNSNLTYLSIFENKIISWLLILSPLILILITGTLKNYFVFNIASNRGLSENDATGLISPLLLLSVFTFFCKFYKKNISIKKILLSLLYFFAIIWISGKRFMIANLILLLVYYICSSEISIKIRKKIFFIAPISLIALISFSAIYLTKIRPLSDTSMSSVYEMLRVDFGRDDVIKYVIDKEILNDNKILDYRGQTIISMFLFWIPRRIWPNKPYPHYRYLTASILSLPINNLPAGTTPSWFEMCICNFGILGFFIAPILLLLFCKLTDSGSSIDIKAIGLMLITVLLTQCMDVYIIYIVILIFIKFISIVFKNKKIKIIWR